MRSILHWILIPCAIYFENVSSTSIFFQDVSSGASDQKDETVIPSPGSCLMPNNPANGEYTIGNATVGTFKPGSYVLAFSRLRVICSRNHKPSPPDKPVASCVNAEWSSKPTCALSCDGINSTNTTEVSCTHKGKPLPSCIDAVEDTVATITCEPLYTEPYIKQDHVCVCKDGNWDRPFTRCYPVREPPRKENAGSVSSQDIYTEVAENQPETVNQPSGSCLMPSNPAKGEYTIGDTPIGIFKPGSFVSPFSPLRVICRTNYKPSPPDKPVALCTDGVWSPEPATCSLSCPGINSTKTTKVSCAYQTRSLQSCNDAIENTVATTTCEPFHEDKSIYPTPFRICVDGSWDRPDIQCSPVCGIKRPKGTPNIVGGQAAEIGDYPWHVGIYRADTKQQICGGSILSERVILSAAHCFTDASNGVKYPKENYLVAAGKYYRMYDDGRDKLEQHATIEEIYIPARYKGAVSYFEADLSVVVLATKLTLSAAVQPVCIDWNTEFEYQQISGNNQGVVVGWGATKEGAEPSEKLKELNVPVIPYDQCFQEVPKSFRKYLTHDKICAGFLNNGTAVCQGDAGGGLTFKDNTDRYYIRGIVSTGPRSIEGTCDFNQYATYTLVSKHIDFIKRYGF